MMEVEKVSKTSESSTYW